jgi:hypothetical protein
MTAYLLPMLLFAQVEAGPKVGEKVPALKVTVVVGELEGKDVDLVVERKEQPTAYLLVNAEKFSRPMARFLRELDGQLGEVDDKASAVAVSAAISTRTRRTCRRPSNR